MKKVKSNMIFQIMYQLIIIIVPLIVTPFITRKLGVVGYGSYTYSYTITTYFVLFCSLGITYHGNRTIAFNRDDQEKLEKSFWSLFLLQSTASLLTLSVYLCYYFFFSRNLITLIFTLQIVSALFDISWLYFGLENIKLIVLRNILIKILSTVLIFCLIRSSNDIWIYALIITLSNILTQVILWISVPKYIKKIVIDKKEIKSAIKPIIMLFIPVLATSIYKIMDKIMLGYFSGDYYVGIYEAADKIVNIPLSFITAIGTVMLPRVSNMVKDGKHKEINKVSSYTIQLSVGISAAMCFGILAIGDDFVGLYYGNEFQESTIVLQLLVFDVLFLSWQQIFRTHYITPYQRDKEFTITLIIGAILNLILNLILIPKFNAKGAAIATISTEGLVMILTTFFSRSGVSIKKHLVLVIPYILFGFIMYGSIILINKNITINNNIIKFLVLICIGGVIYILLSAIYVLIRYKSFILSKFRGKKDESR